MMTGRHYTIPEIVAMRSICRDLATPTNISYRQEEVFAQAEDALRTYMANGTTLEELSAERSRKWDAEVEASRRHQELMEEYQRLFPPPPEPPAPTTEEEVMERWFTDCVAKHDGASAKSDDLFDGFMGMTLARFANRHAPDGVFVTQKGMERLLVGKGVKYRRAGTFAGKTFDGIRHITHGNVRLGSYGT
jgi:hypothetical protein